MDAVTLLNNNLATYIGLALLGSLLLGATLSDLKSHRIPNKLVLTGLFSGLLFSFLAPQAFSFVEAGVESGGLTRAFAGCLTGLALLLPFYALRALGAGDVKLMAMIGAFFSPTAIVSIVLLTFITGGLLAVLMALKKNVFLQMVSNLRQMAIGSYFKLALHEMPTFSEGPPSAAKMPYAVAIASGTFIYIVLAYRGHMPLIRFM